MRILFWTQWFWPEIGGVQIFTTKLLSALRERGHEMLVVTSQASPNQPVEAQYKGIPIYRLPFRDIGSYANLDQLMAVRQQISQLKRTFASDLVHMNYAADFSNFFHLTTANAYPAPVLVTLHGKWSNNSSLDQRILHEADWVACVSVATLNAGRQLVPEITSRSCVIYNGLELPSLLPQPLPTEAPRLLCLGRLSPEKGVDLAVAAFASVAMRFPQARLVIAGDGPTRADLEQQATALQLRERSDFLGWIAPEAVAALLNTATLVLMPSRSEGLPLVALETALMARPIVATRVGGLPEVVVHGETGLLVEPEDPRALAEAIAHLLAHPETARQMGQAARSRAQAVFSWERHVTAYDALYQQLVTNWRKRASMRG